MFFFFKQKTAYEMRISDWSSDVCSSDLVTANKSFGATTLRQRHAKASGKTLRLQYVAKGGAKRDVTISDRSLSTLVRRLQDLPGQKLFQYEDADSLCAVGSDDVNAYIREAMGDEFSAKHFRTWSASVEAFAFLYDAPEPLTLKAMLEHVADRLGNPPAIARKRSEEHTSELPSLMRISNAVFCLKTKTTTQLKTTDNTQS